MVNTRPISELRKPMTYEQSFNGPEILNNGSTIIYGSGCYFGERFILTTLFRDDLTGHIPAYPFHLNIERKFEKILVCGSEFIRVTEDIARLSDTFWLPHIIPWNN